jgi:hypothetical protein
MMSPLPGLRVLRAGVPGVRGARLSLEKEEGDVEINGNLLE